MKKSNKSIAGYHLLMILSAVDFKFHIEEELIIKQFLQHEFPLSIPMDKELEVISALHPEQWKDHFLFHAQCFLEDSIAQERTQFLEFAKNLIHADDYVNPVENMYYKLLVLLWLHK